MISELLDFFSNLDQATSLTEDKSSRKIKIIILVSIIIGLASIILISQNFEKTDSSFSKFTILIISALLSLLNTFVFYKLKILREINLITLIFFLIASVLFFFAVGLHFTLEN